MSPNKGSEIITLQFGQYSNFIGTHWWNLQEAGFDYTPDLISDINHDVLFREGLNHRKEVTFTPRMLLVDLKGSLQTCVNDLYEDVTTQADILNSITTWSPDKVEIVNDSSTSSSKTNEFQEDLKKLENNREGVLSEVVDYKDYNLEDNVNYWSDFMRTRYHPRSFNVVNEYQHGNTGQPFDCYLQGVEVWKSEAMCEEWTDKVRAFVEECDCLQGFQILSDATSGFAGLCSSSLQHLKDEYSTKATLVFPVTPPRTSESDFKLRTVNTVLMMASLGELADMFSPLSLSPDCWNQTETYRQFPLLEYKPSLLYHSSAIVSSLLDTLSLSYRLRGGSGLSLRDLCSFLTPVGRKAATTSLSLPWPMKHAQSLLECLEQWEGPLSTPLTPYSNLDEVAIQVLNLRGEDGHKMFPKDMNNRDRSSNPAYSCTTVHELFQYFLSCDMPRTLHRVYSSSQPIKTINPYPDFFSKRVSNHGCVNEPLEEKERVKHVPMLGGLHCCQGSGAMLSDLHSAVRRINIKTLPAFLSLDKTDFDETLEAVMSLSDNYKDEYEL
uniref:Protein misato n=2 Tax=Cacopsylla melanoneura TaxID=428564 RepID=A0A8D9AW22_9HEMI